jgi:hypothetical protein
MGVVCAIAASAVWDVQLGTWGDPALHTQGYNMVCYKNETDDPLIIGKPIMILIPYVQHSQP